MGSRACHTTSDAELDTSSEINTKDLKKKVDEKEAKNGRDAIANGDTSEKNGERKADNEIHEEEERGVEEEEEGGDGKKENGDEG
ncbi:Prothymosin alpha [Myotis davidii]|uniref:Prothymosin alpha n=1 Tax=Myotis davidii TaxID=225400 RepID=L5LYF0_MYODS|nr:Prothymosin alpha [Myotis davidii]